MDETRRALADTPKPKGQTIRDIIRETIENDCHFMPNAGGDTYLLPLNMVPADEAGSGMDDAQPDAASRAADLLPFAGTADLGDHDDTAAATPLDSPVGYDLDTCSQKHQRMMAYQARRIDQLQFDLETAAGEIVHLRALGSMTEARVARLEAILEDWSAGK